MSIHKGHRDRVRKRFLEEGLENFEQHQVLELLLFHCVAQKDTNPIAHNLIERFGSFSGVMDAPVEELQKVDGVGEKTAAFLSMIMQMWQYYYVDKSMQTPTILSTIKECGEYLVPLFSGLSLETVYLLCLDAKCKLLRCERVGEGSVNSAAVPIRRIVEIALASNASTVVLAHNHPSGLAIPSGDDISTTRRVAAALDAVEVGLVDHIVVADNEFVSLAESGLYHPGECRVLL